MTVGTKRNILYLSKATGSTANKGAKVAAIAGECQNLIVVCICDVYGMISRAAVGFHQSRVVYRYVIDHCNLRR